MLTVIYFSGSLTRTRKRVDQREQLLLMAFRGGAKRVYLTRRWRRFHKNIINTRIHPFIILLRDIYIYQWFVIVALVHIVACAQQSERKTRN